MVPSQLEPFLRMAIGHIREAQRYMEYAPETPGMVRAQKDLTETIGRIQKYAKDRRIELRHSMKT